MAGRDINNITGTQAASGANKTTLDRQAVIAVTGAAGQSGSQLTMVAAGDINLTASQVRSAGAAALSAGGSVNMQAVTTSEVFHNESHGEAEFRQHLEQSSQTGSTIQAKGGLTVSATQDISATATTIQSDAKVTLQAGNNVLLFAGQNTSSSDLSWVENNKGFVTTTSTATRRQEQNATAQRSTVSGKDVSVTAGNALVSVGTEFNGKDSLKIDGKEKTLLYEPQDVHTSTVTTQTQTGLGVMFNPLGIDIALEDKTVTDSRASSTAIGTKLVSTQRIEIGVGNKTELRGTEVEAPQIAFVKTDPNKKGELILGGSTNTTQTSHTEKSETAGVWQEQKGQGSTTQTLNQTQLKGNVAFDSALKISAQIPDTKGGQALKSQINALLDQSGGTGLEYLNQLAANPNVQWDKVALAQEKWSYDQAGLTPAGAALLSIAVAAYMPGASGMFGTTTATGTTLGGVALTTTTAAGVTTATFAGAALNAGFTALASQAAVAMVNNKGDIGKTLEQLGSEQSIKNLLTTMVTAGALDKLNASYFKGVDAKSSFIDQLQKNLGNNVATDMMNSALAGKPFDENTLANSLKGALINTGTAQGANAIGDGLVAKNLNEFTHKLVHAVLGCAGAEASGGDCRSGAVGAVVGELTAEYAVKSGMNNADALALAKVLAALPELLKN